ncbi:nucleoside diphosphate kinase regulator [Idiomarina xiamenensis]|uniref:Regulator of nucleoside diphosphate kinase n=1 Tax=Idiomarina xiamenensis 10-D-4 TaxID=740709 RepID=K2KR23_9GAMM|nr:nucleoside diphosphate kinase regulator [Idiomarina xiamenensis]EKE79955.1 Regulator of nucleoside diphosphate kinase [Idiomarina xiamenensis 10-D-4]
MQPLPSIVLSELDVCRIERLLDEDVINEQVHELLEQELSRALVLVPKAIPPERVSMNSTLRFRIVESGASFERTLCYPKDWRNAQQHLSILSNVGSGLIGLAEGDRIYWPNRDSHFTLEVLAVLNQPERNGDYHL